VDRVTQEKQILIYADERGNEPFSVWIHNLKDISGRKRIFTRIDRLRYGNYGDCEPVGEGVSELRMHFGPGYRVYFAEKGNTIIILLCGGDKGDQKQCIKNAKLYWKEYQKHEKL
jgi:putative addiction module killer protein